MTTHTETQRVVEMLTTREKEARHWQKSLYADDLASALALITRQQEEVERLKEYIHYANGVADLAIKHRDSAEAALALVRWHTQSIDESDIQFLRERVGDGGRGQFWQRYVSAIRSTLTEEN